MPHLMKIRKGWQNEHIAKFILSQFSFLAEPSTIADDIGSDFMCTIFKINKDEHLIPQSPFTIQIKSNKRTLEITRNCSYFQNLEIPYFVGVVKKERLTMRVYSGEAIPHFFSTYTGKVTKDGYRAFIRLLENPPHRNHNFISCDDSKKKCYLDFPFITELNAKGSNDVDELIEVCKLIQYNISSRSTKSYLYYLYGWNGVNIYTGKDSVQAFRQNFSERLTEALLNLEWLYDNNSQAFDYNEYKIFKTTAEKLIKKYGTASQLLDNVLTKIDNKINIKQGKIK